MDRSHTRFQCTSKEVSESTVLGIGTSCLLNLNTVHLAKKAKTWCTEANRHVTGTEVASDATLNSGVGNNVSAVVAVFTELIQVKDIEELGYSFQQGHIFEVTGSSQAVLEIDTSNASAQVNTEALLKRQVSQSVDENWSALLVFLEDWETGTRLVVFNVEVVAKNQEGSI